VLAVVLSVLLILGGGAWRMRAQLAVVLQGIRHRVTGSHTPRTATPPANKTTHTKEMTPVGSDPRTVELPGGQIVPRGMGTGGAAPGPVNTAPTIIEKSTPAPSSHAASRNSGVATAPQTTHPAEPGPTPIGSWTTTTIATPESIEPIRVEKVMPSTPSDDMPVETVFPGTVGPPSDE